MHDKDTRTAISPGSIVRDETLQGGFALSILDFSGLNVRTGRGFGTTASSSQRHNGQQTTIQQHQSDLEAEIPFNLSREPDPRSE